MSEDPNFFELLKRLQSRLETVRDNAYTRIEALEKQHGFDWRGYWLEEIAKKFEARIAALEGWRDGAKLVIDAHNEAILESRGSAPGNPYHACESGKCTDLCLCHCHDKKPTPPEPAAPPCPVPHDDPSVCARPCIGPAAPKCAFRYLDGPCGLVEATHDRMTHGKAHPFTPAPASEAGKASEGHMVGCNMQLSVPARCLCGLRTLKITPEVEAALEAYGKWNQRLREAWDEARADRAVADAAARLIAHWDTPFSRKNEYAVALRTALELRGDPAGTEKP